MLHIRYNIQLPKGINNTKELILCLKVVVDAVVVALPPKPRRRKRRQSKKVTSK